MKLRIIKIEEFKGNDKPKVYYAIQKKFLFIWLFYKIRKIHCPEFYPRFFSIYKSSTWFVLEEDARQFLNKIKNPFREKYKGQKISVVFTNSLTPFYITWSLNNALFGESGFQYATDIEDLKSMIDKRKIKRKISLI